MESVSGSMRSQLQTIQAKAHVQSRHPVNSLPCRHGAARFSKFFFLKRQYIDSIRAAAAEMDVVQANETEDDDLDEDGEEIDVTELQRIFDEVQVCDNN